MDQLGRTRKTHEYHFVIELEREPDPSSSSIAVTIRTTRTATTKEVIAHPLPLPPLPLKKKRDREKDYPHWKGQRLPDCGQNDNQCFGLVARTNDKKRGMKHVSIAFNSGLPVFFRRRRIIWKRLPFSGTLWWKNKKENRFFK